MRVYITKSVEWLSGATVSGSLVRAIVVIQVLLLNLKSFQKMLQVELSVKAVMKSSP